LYVEGALCLPGFVSTKKIHQIVFDYVKARPATWGQPASGLIEMALVETFPCTTGDE